MKVSHQKLVEWLAGGHVQAVSSIGKPLPWPDNASKQSEWTALSHFTLGCAMSELIQPNQLGALSLRVSTTTLAPLFWPSAQICGVVNDWSPQQMGLDFCLMGPTGNRVHYMTAESETGKSESVSISLSERGYIWDWSKLLGDVSEHRLLIAVVRGASRRAMLITNLQAFYAGKSQQGIQHVDGIGGYVIASEAEDRADSFTFVVHNGALDFQPIPAGTF